MPFPFRPYALCTYINRQTLLLIKTLLSSLRNNIRILSVFFSAMSSAGDPPPPPFDPLEPAVPVSFPISTLEDLGARSYFDSFHYPFNVASVKLDDDPVSVPNRPRMLVCHDMAGGYKDDRWVQGGNNADAYAMWHWYLIDVFVYFSHTLVTLPPPCWTNTAHKHGVKVLGTFIAEWDEGRVIANKLLSTKNTCRMYAERLAELAVALGFDGWLINMEVQLDVVQIPTLIEFVSHLTQTMHSSKPGSLVIWYDSVTVNGDRKWQNQLNNYNKPFFDVCDGIFVNYSWKEDYPKLSADVAGSRKFDVYMGIDVFGRNTYGGGQWKTNVALDVLKKDDVSAAIFAPGWVYETNQPPDFQTAQNRWWSLVEKSWGIVQKYPKVLPFYSNFDQGRGYHLSLDGDQILDGPWNNIASQSFQPFLEFTGDQNQAKIEVFVDYKDASYNGGGNIVFKGSLEDNAYFTTRLFLGELLLEDSPLYFTCSVKLDGSSLFGLYLQFSSAPARTTSVLLASLGNKLLLSNQFSSKFDKVIMPHRVTKLEQAPGWVLQESSISMNGYVLTEIHAVCYLSEPDSSKLRLEPVPKIQTSTLSRGSSEYYAVLGHIKVKLSGQNSVFPPSSSWLVKGQYVKWTSGSQGSKLLSLKITWKLKDENALVFPKYNIYVKLLASQLVEKPDEAPEVVQNYLGLAHLESFYISDLEVPVGTSSVVFIIQVCGFDGVCQTREDSPSYQLVVEDS